MAAVTVPLVVVAVSLLASAILYTLAILALDRLLELLQRQPMMQQFQAVSWAAICALRLMMAYLVTRQHIRRLGGR
jgi:hypothetical protein